MQDDKGDLRSRYFETPYPAAKWGIIILTKNEEMKHKFLLAEKEKFRLKIIGRVEAWRMYRESNS